MYSCQLCRSKFHHRRGHPDTSNNSSTLTHQFPRQPDSDTKFTNLFENITHECQKISGQLYANCEFASPMIAVIDKASSEALQPLKKPKTPDSDRKNWYNSKNHPLTWLILSVFFVQIFLLLIARSLPTTVYHRRRHFPAPYTPAIAVVDPQCTATVFVYDLPPVFNSELLQKCSELDPWASRCKAFSNDGFGRRATGLNGIVPENLTHAWYWTDQFASEIIYHNRILKYKCRTLEPESATAFYIPFYAGLAVGKYLWKNYTAEDRDRHCHMMLKWVQTQPYWYRSNGSDHFITMGRISWDFRRSKDEDWGSSCIYSPGMRNVTRLLIERNPWDYFDVGVPYPTGFHPSTASDLVTWQEFVRTRRRSTLYCFAGATRVSIKNDFRGVLLSQCYSDSQSGLCRVVDCGGSKCLNGSSAIFETFLDSDFCLQPRGDSFTRRSVFDCMVAGSIPVFFWKRTAYYQYEWFLPGEPGSYSVFIDRNAVTNGTSIRGELEKISREEVRRMREKVIEYIPRLVYAKPSEGLVGIKDAFDVAIDGVLRRIKEQQGSYNLQVENSRKGSS